MIKSSRAETEYPEKGRARCVCPGRETVPGLIHLCMQAEAVDQKDGKRKQREKISSQEVSADHRAVDTSSDRADQPGRTDRLYVFIIEDAG